MAQAISTVEQTKCLNNLLANSTEDAKVGEFRKVAEAKLNDLAAVATAEEDSYRAAVTELETRWKDQNEKICKIRIHMDNCHESARTNLEEAVCEDVIQEIWTLQNRVMADIGPPEKRLDAARYTFETAGAQLDAWKTISAWISTRLDNNQLLIDEICTLDNCQDRLFALYILHFELLPAHWQLQRKPADLPMHLTDPERAYCASACASNPPPVDGNSCCGFPWLISPGDYNCILAGLWECWRDAGVASAMEESRYEQIERDRGELAQISDPLVKRENARKALRLRDEENCPCEPDGQPGDGSSTPPGSPPGYNGDAKPPAELPPGQPASDPYGGQHPPGEPPAQPPYAVPPQEPPTQPPYGDTDTPPQEPPTQPPYGGTDTPPREPPTQPPYGKQEEPPPELPPGRPPQDPYGKTNPPPDKSS